MLVMFTKLLGMTEMKHHRKFHSSTFRTETESYAVSKIQNRRGQCMLMNEYPFILQAEVRPYGKRCQSLVRQLLSYKIHL